MHRLLVDIYGEHALSDTTSKNGFGESTMVISTWVTKNAKAHQKKFEYARLQALLNEDRFRSLVELSKELNVDKSTSD